MRRDDITVNSEGEVTEKVSLYLGQGAREVCFIRESGE
jgi:hypothetical protein